MIIEKTFPSGGYEIYETIGNELVTRRYFGHTKKEAIALFNQEKQRVVK